MKKVCNFVPLLLSSDSGCTPPSMCYTHTNAPARPRERLPTATKRVISLCFRLVVDMFRLALELARARATRTHAHTHTLVLIHTL